MPAQWLHALLDAFEQDVRNPRYADRDELLDYCRRSANPIGRLLLHLYGIEDAPHCASDAICSALQLINFWQDLSVDGPRGRLYIPQADLAAAWPDFAAAAPCRRPSGTRADTGAERLGTALMPGRAAGLHVARPRRMGVAIRCARWPAHS